jgi:hypothetical protein
MDNSFAEVWKEIVARPSGPMALRFYLQPLMATLIAIRDGVRDAHGGRPPYFWSLCSERSRTRERLHEGWRAVRKIFFLALILDTVYQLVVLHGLRPLSGLFVAAALALIPYILLRGPANRVARLLARSRGGDRSARA